MVLNELQASQTLFLDSIAGVSQAQWIYKAGPDRWSIAEVSEQIVAADAAQAAQRQPMNPKIDARLLAAIRDGSKKATGHRRPSRALL